MGIAAVLTSDDRVLGVFTDGDLRRLIEQGSDLRALRAQDVMNLNPSVIKADALAAEAAALMETRKVTSVLVVDVDGRFLGAVNTNALLRAKVI